MQNQFLSAIEQICEEKGISKDMVLDAIEAAIIAAYKKDFGDKEQEVRVELNPDSGEATIFVTKEVVENVEDPMIQLTLANAKKVKKDAIIGDMIEIKEDNKDFGRVAAQTAKQVIVQRIREAERDVVFSEFSDKEGLIINATVQRFENGNTYIDLGKATGVMFPSDQIPNEKYYPGQKIKVYVVRVEQTNRGPQIVVSRSHPDMVRRLFEMEVPEIANGTVEIAGIAREAGARTKISVKSNAEGVDPVGTFVGGRGTRVQAVMGELGEEKIDIIAYSENPAEYITNALSPTKVINVKIDEENKKALVKVPEDQLSLAIGKSGQNVRLAAKLTGWNVDIDGADDAGIEATAEEVEEKPKPKKAGDLEDALIAASTDEVEKEEAAEEAEDKPAVETEAESNDEAK
ncbi:transcription termination/antitermination protein NusA [Candidatus Saccharibacteria bacterium]|nr:transcription termination/antitermination protein NusA [Candidatus Saccharibacteria bacterium]